MTDLRGYGDSSKPPAGEQHANYPKRAMAADQIAVMRALGFSTFAAVVTNMTRPAERVSKFYNGRGTAEQWIREGKNALRWTRLSCHAFHNAVRPQLFALAYNLANFLRSL